MTEVVSSEVPKKRGRGRPKGSKNKPKVAPVTQAKQPETSKTE